VKAARLLAVVGEARALAAAVRDEVVRDPPPVVVTGVLAEQLAKELAAGAAPGAVIVGGAQLPAELSVLVHVIAGEPSEEDADLVRRAARRYADTVIVELWPQEDWTRPFVLSPLVVECRAGEGFPVREIADRIAEAVADAQTLASRIPVLADPVRDDLVGQAVVRSALIGLAGSRLGVSRPLLTLEQVRLATHLHTLSTTRAAAEEQRRELAGEAAAALAAGFAFRALARRTRTVLPAPVVHAAVAAAGTWVVAKAIERVEARLPSS
jgi:hypothetical protein